jgi:hypothetical protein
MWYYSEEEARDNMTLKDYLKMYRKPLSKGSVEAIVKLTKVAQEKKKKIDKKAKEKTKEGVVGKDKKKKKDKKEKKGSKALEGVLA